jgi:hypothetical protein
LRAIDGVAETPAADRFYALAMSALRPLCGQTGAALAARRDRADQNPVADIVSRQSFSEFLDHAHRFVSDHESGFHWIFAAHDMNIGAADGR